MSGRRRRRARPRRDGLPHGDIAGNDGAVDPILTGIKFESARILDNRAARTLDYGAFYRRWRRGDSDAPGSASAWPGRTCPGSRQGLRRQAHDGDGALPRTVDHGLGVEDQGVAGQAVTPFVLSYLHRESGGRTLAANRELILLGVSQVAPRPEPVQFSAPVGELEAFHTAGGLSTMAFRYEGKIPSMEYKTLRYPGHVAVMRPIRDLGLLANEPVEVKGKKVAPRDVFIAAVHPKLHKPEGRDLVALQVQVTGQKMRKPARITFRLIDYYDALHGISAMMRTTGYSLSITGQMQVRGEIGKAGVFTPDEAIPAEKYIKEALRYLDSMTDRERFGTRGF